MATQVQAEQAAVDVEQAQGRGGTFRALRHRNYRLLWLGQMGHSASLWMEQVVRPVLVYELTESALLVSFVVFMRMIPVLLFGVLAGVVADRYDKRRILSSAQAVTMAMHFLLAVLVLTGVVAVWQIFVTAMISGAAMAFNQPARQSLIPKMVPPDDVMNAVALNTMAMNFMRIGGGAIAGLLLIVLSPGGVYLLNGIIYFGVIASTELMRFPKEDRNRPRGSFSADLGEGFAYVRSNRPVLGLVAMSMVLFVLGMPYQQVFVPLLALDEYNLSRSWVGWMLSCTGAGALCGSLWVASRARYNRPDLALVINLIVFGVALVWLGATRWLPLTLLGLAVAGSMTVSFMAVTNALLLSITPQDLHGRVMSLMSLDRGIIPLGAIFAGVLSEQFSPRVGLLVMGSLVLLLTGVAWLALGPTLRHLGSAGGIARPVRAGRH
jgi:MFS transporter, DHA1 family, staphyloferrin A biosynthesis exporter